MFSGRAAFAFCSQTFEGADEFRPGFGGFDDLVYVSFLCGDVGACEFLAVLTYELVVFLLRVFSFRDFLSEDYVDGTVRTHDGDFGCRPCIVDVGA